MVCLSATTNFGTVAFRKEKLVLGFVLAGPLESPRVTRTERVSSRTWAHHVDVRSPGDLDDEVSRWLRDAYELGRAAGSR